MLRIDLLVNDGSPIGVTMHSLWGEDGKRIGVGGSEYALLTMCEAWHNAGHKVTLYNTPFEPNVGPFEQKPISAFVPSEDRDVLITFRSPNAKSIIAKGLKVWWSCDQYTVGNFSVFAKEMDKIVCISKFHQEHFKNAYNILNTDVIDIPVRVQDFAGKNIERVHNRFIFTSVPQRGLQHLRKVWDGLKRKVPDASLVITSDYRLWGADCGNEHHRISWMGVNDLQFLGAVKRERLIEEQLKAEFFIYPCEYDELFCVSLAEAQVAGCYPFTTSVGALAETSRGVVTNHLPNTPFFEKTFTDMVLENMDNGRKIMPDVQMYAIDRFNINTIMRQWNTKIFGENK